MRPSLFQNATVFCLSKLFIIKHFDMKVKFICRESKKTKDGLVSIEVSVTNMGVRKIISTGRKIKPNQFSPKTETVKGNEELNEYISAIRSRLYSIETYLIKNGINATPDAVIYTFHNGEIELHGVVILPLQCFQLHKTTYQLTNALLKMSSVRASLISDTSPDSTALRFCVLE